MKLILSVSLALLCFGAMAQAPLSSDPSQAPGQGGPGQRRQRPTPTETPPPTEPGTQAPALPTVLDQMHAAPDSRTWVVTHHIWHGNGTSISYTATCGFIPIKNDNDETTAQMFFVAYTKDDEDKGSRPVTFAFNGGPGSSSVWLHMGALGPRRAMMNPDGSLPAPPYKVVDNEESWLPSTDIVMIDAVGTGYSRPTKPEYGRQFYAMLGDLSAFTAFIKGYMSDTGRWLSPVFVAGESYGGIRVAGLSYTLLQAGIAVNGIISISGVMNFGTIDPSKDNDIPYLSYLPAECACAMYHHKTSPDMAAHFDDTIAACEKFADGPYAAALMKGNTLSPAESKSITERLAHFTGLSPIYIERSNLRISPFGFRAELLRDNWQIIGRYDGRLVGNNSNGVAQGAEFDPSDAATTPVFTAGFNDYITNELNFHTSEQYRIVAYGQLGSWDYGSDGQTPDTSEYLRRALEQNPHLRVMCCCGWFDLACPYFGMRYVMDHLGENPKLEKNIRFRYFHSGHMLYIDTASRQKFVKDVGQFMADATGPGR